eukprot:1142667-Pelagomonas_calceolata.AAC.1
MHHAQCSSHHAYILMLRWLTFPASFARCASRSAKKGVQSSMQPIYLTTLGHAAYPRSPVHDLSRHVQACAGMCWHVQACVGMCRHVYACVGMCRRVQACAGVCKHVQARAGVCRRVLVCAGMCRHGALACLLSLGIAGINARLLGCNKGGQACNMRLDSSCP